MRHALLLLLFLAPLPAAAQPSPAQTYADSLDTHLQTVTALYDELGRVRDGYDFGASGFEATSALQRALLLLMQQMGWAGYAVRFYGAAIGEGDAAGPRPDLRDSLVGRLGWTHGSVISMKTMVSAATYLCDPADCDEAQTDAFAERAQALATEGARLLARTMRALG